MIALLAIALIAAADDAPPKVHASHKVDVIAPGERVETVIERMRGSTAHPPAPPAGTRSGGEMPPVRGPGKGPGGPDHGRPDAPRGPDQMRGPHMEGPDRTHR